jgi:hypothetical protein
VFETAALGCRKPPPKKFGGGFRFGVPKKVNLLGTLEHSLVKKHFFTIVKPHNACCVCRIASRIIRSAGEKVDEIDK